MFKSWKKTSIDVFFYTTREEVFNHAKPKKAATFIPEWFKTLPRPYFSNEADSNLTAIKTIRSCPGFIELYKSGFMFPLWSDVNIKINSNGTFQYQFADYQSSIGFHSNEQFSGSSFEQTHTELKFINPWYWSTKEKINFMFVSPTWNCFGYEDIVVAPGAYSPHTTIHQGNVNLFFKKPDTTKIYELTLGQPLVHVVPLSDRPVNLHYELVSENDIRKMKNKSPMELMFKNRFKRSEKLCSHA